MLQKKMYPLSGLQELDLRMLVDKQHVETGAARFTVYCASTFDRFMCSSAGRRHAHKTIAISSYSRTHDGKTDIGSLFGGPMPVKNTVLRRIPILPFQLIQMKQLSFAPKNSLTKAFKIS